MIPSVIFDIDKVMVNNPNTFNYSEMFSTKYNVDLENFIEFLNSDYKQAKVGKCDLEKCLKDRLVSWHVKTSVENIFEEWYTPQELEVNKELLNVIAKNTNYKYYLASNNERYRGELLWNDLGLSKYFAGKFFSYEIGYTKEDPEFFITVCKMLNENPKGILFVDDKVKNVESANHIGLNTLLYENNSKFFNDVKEFLIEFK